MGHRRSGFAKKIDSVHWTIFGEMIVGLSAGTIGRTLFSAQHMPETHLRLRGEWGACFTTAIAPATGVIVVAGIIQVPEGTGTTVLWSPFTDGDAPWIWWDTLGLIYTEQVIDQVGSVPLFAGRRVMDSKAMRKIRNTELQLVVENLTATGLTAGDVNVFVTGRSLSGT